MSRWCTAPPAADSGRNAAPQQDAATSQEPVAPHNAVAGIENIVMNPQGTPLLVYSAAVHPAHSTECRIAFPRNGGRVTGVGARASPELR
jgi:hypothetical protein